jgi:hypothetical protein
MDEQKSCEKCGFRAKYDHRPKSLLGRLWRWHTGWCPGWRQYMASLPEDTRTDIAKRYGMKKFL